MTILITANVDDASIERLETELDTEVEYRPIGEREARFPPEEVTDLLEGVSVFIVGYEGVSAEIIDEADSLRLIGCPRGGPDANIDIAAATERGIPVVYAPGRNAISVADMTLGMMLGVARHIPQAHHLLHEGVYTGESRADAAGGGGEREDVTWGIAKNTPYMDLKGPELDGKRLGIVGLGAIGQLVAARAGGFGMELVAYDPFIDAETMAEHGVEKVELDALLETSDFVTVHSPVTDDTRGMLGAEEFGSMKDSAYFINTARAALTDQEALVAELEAGGLRGAALDVYAGEPLPEDHPLLSMDNVVTTPHIAGAAEEVPARGAGMVTDDLVAIINGDEPKHIANPDALEAFTGLD
jgi:D-3-phosphoglycerate dehydrogenase / 2-oxoglutarate reductase